VLQPFSKFHNGIFSSDGMKTIFHNLSAQHTCHIFAMVRAPKNRIKFVHSLGRYVSPMGTEVTERNYNRYFGFKGDRTKRGNPPLVQFKTTFLTKKTYYSHALKKVVTHFGKKDLVVVMAVDDTEGEMDIPSAVQLPLKWVVEMIEKHPYPNEFLELIFKKTVGWLDAENKLADYLITWSVTA